MDSGWVVNFKDGESVIMTEKAYAEHQLVNDKALVETEDHYFDIREAIKKHPWLEVLT